MISSRFFSAPVYPQRATALTAGGFLTELQEFPPESDRRYEIHGIQAQQKYNVILGWTLRGLQNLDCHGIAYNLHPDFQKISTAQGQHIFCKKVAVPNEPSKFLWNRKLRQLGRDEFEDAYLGLFDAYMKNYKYFSTNLGFKKSVDEALDLASRESLARFQLDDNDSLTMMKKIVNQLRRNQLIQEGKNDGMFIKDEDYRDLSAIELEFLHVRGWE